MNSIHFIFFAPFSLILCKIWTSLIKKNKAKSEKIQMETQRVSEEYRNREQEAQYENETKLKFKFH